MLFPLSSFFVRPQIFFFPYVLAAYSERPPPRLGKLYTIQPPMPHFPPHHAHTHCVAHCPNCAALRARQQEEEEDQKRRMEASAKAAERANSTNGKRDSFGTTHNLVSSSPSVVAACVVNPSVSAHHVFSFSLSILV